MGLLVFIGVASAQSDDIYPGSAAPPADIPASAFGFGVWDRWQHTPAAQTQPAFRAQPAPQVQIAAPTPGPKRASLGVTLVPQQNLAATVSKVRPGSPAAAAGLRPGDRILALGEQPVENYQELIRMIGASSPNSNVRLYVVRNGQPLAVVAKLVSPDLLEGPIVQRMPSSPPSLGEHLIGSK